MILQNSSINMKYRRCERIAGWIFLPRFLKSSQHVREDVLRLPNSETQSSDLFDQAERLKKHRRRGRNQVGRQETQNAGSLCTGDFGPLTGDLREKTVLVLQRFPYISLCPLVLSLGYSGLVRTSSESSVKSILLTCLSDED